MTFYLISRRRNRLKEPTIGQSHAFTLKPCYLASAQLWKKIPAYLYRRHKVSFIWYFFVGAPLVRCVRESLCTVYITCQECHYILESNQRLESGFGIHVKGKINSRAAWIIRDWETSQTLWQLEVLKSVYYIYMLFTLPYYCHFQCYIVIYFPKTQNVRIIFQIGLTFVVVLF